MSINNCGNIYGVDIDKGETPTPFDCEDPYTLIENPSEIDCDGDCQETDCCEQLEEVEEVEETEETEETEVPVSSQPASNQNTSDIGNLCRICFYYQNPETNQKVNEAMGSNTSSCKTVENITTSTNHIPDSDLISFFGFKKNNQNDMYILTNSNALEYFYKIENYKKRSVTIDSNPNTIIVIKNYEYPTKSIIPIYNNLGEEIIQGGEIDSKIKGIYDEFRNSRKLKNNSFDINLDDPNTYDKLREIINYATDPFYRH